LQTDNPKGPALNLFFGVFCQPYHRLRLLVPLTDDKFGDIGQNLQKIVLQRALKLKTVSPERVLPAVSQILSSG